MQYYQEQVLSNNISHWYQKLLQDKIGGEEIVLTTKCQLSKISVTIPIRHTQMGYIHCLFDLDSWMEHYKQMQNKVEPTGFYCPGCKKYTNFKDYGVDQTFYHVLEEMRLFKMRNPNIKLQTKQQLDLTVNESQLIYQPSKNIYYVETKVVNPPNSKIKLVPQRYPLPGCVPIFGVSRRQQQITNQHQNENQKRILDEMSQTIVKLQQLLFSKLYKIFKKNSNLTFKSLQDKVAAKKHLCKQELAKSLKLVQLGRKSLSDDYVFALKKISLNNQLHSILIVYLVQYGIWYEYDLTFNGQPYVQLEQALYIKGESDAQRNTIYIIGGQKQDRFAQSNQCLQLTFPRNPFQSVEEQAKIVALPDYPLEGYNFMGTSYKGNLFVFYGQRQTKNSDNQIKFQLLNSQYVLRRNGYNQKWEQMRNNLVDRFDGSFFIISHEQFDKLIVFFGGITKDPDGFLHKGFYFQKFCINIILLIFTLKIINQFYISIIFHISILAGSSTHLLQHSGQIFICKDEKFLGSPKQDFLINFAGQDEYHKSVLASPVFSCPYYGNNQLILSGECLKYKNAEIREIYTFDWGNAEMKLNELFSLEPPEFIFTPYRRRISGYDIFSPVQDPQGAISYGFFYLIHQYEVDQNQNEKGQKVMTQLLKINLTNGLFFTIPYQESSASREVARNNLQLLADVHNQYL